MAWGTNRKMVYSEYVLIKGISPSTFKQHVWLITIVILRFIQMNCYWMLIMSIHIYSPLFSFKITHRLVIIYTSIIIYITLEAIYQRFYKKYSSKFCLGIIHILRKHIIRLWETPPPYVSMFSVLKISN